MDDKGYRFCYCVSFNNKYSVAPVCDFFHKGGPKDTCIRCGHLASCHSWVVPERQVLSDYDTIEDPY